MCAYCGESSTEEWCQSCEQLLLDLKQEILLDINKVMLEDLRQKIIDYTLSLSLTELNLFFDIKKKYFPNKLHTQIIHFCRELDKSSRSNGENESGVKLLLFGLLQNPSEYLTWVD